MIFGDDVDAEKLTAGTVETINNASETLKSAAEQIGKADRRYSDDQLCEMRAAAENLQKIIDSNLISMIALKTSIASRGK
ncbi:hypothetical protein [Roseibium litorale]|uniref:Uncharacterized protein n=1 Tax=Roseibium litorale TaxID=2803841 RepID=A0ABR9CPA3_9HYPH|nr:hypothetical protein [Roseibium litorale]MBD8892700.1 hypothetical protein [Roseibium litorale]